MTTDAVARADTLSDRVAAEIRAEMARQRISGRTLARRMGRSANWVSLKTSGVSTLALNDLEAIAKALDLTPGTLLSRTTHQYVAPPPVDRATVTTPASRPADRRPPNRPSGRASGPVRTYRTRGPVAA